MRFAKVINLPNYQVLVMKDTATDLKVCTVYNNKWFNGTLTFKSPREMHHAFQTFGNKDARLIVETAKAKIEEGQS